MLELYNVDCAADIVMCVDSSGSMSDVLNMVKNNTLTFYQDLKSCCASKGKNLNRIRLRIITFGDLGYSPFMDSGLVVMPQQKHELHQFVSSISESDGADECALEALAVAIQTEWVKDGDRLRHIIIVYTDEDACDLGKLSGSAYYPSLMPRDFAQLTSMWMNMDSKSKELILFAPKSGQWWHRIDAEWDNVIHKVEVESGLSGNRYQNILEAIGDSI